MAQPIETSGTTGLVLYVIRISQTDGKVFNTNTLLYETYNQAHWADYAIGLDEYGSCGYYRGVPPPESLVVPATDVFYSQSGGSPAPTDFPPYTLGASQGDNVYSVNGAILPAKNFGLAAGTEETGAAISGTLTVTQMSTDLTNPLQNAYVGRTVYWTSGQLFKCAAAIKTYDATTHILTFTNVPIAPSAGDTFIIA